MESTYKPGDVVEYQRAKRCHHHKAKVVGIISEEQALYRIVMGQKVRIVEESQLSMVHA